MKTEEANKDITIEEANRLIAEYMGLKYVLERNHIISYSGLKVSPYSKSLDALVPVWEKLNLPKIIELDIRDHNYAKGFGFRTYADLSYSIYEDSSESIQEAACIATAKAIKELK